MLRSITNDEYTIMIKIYNKDLNIYYIYWDRYVPLKVITHKKYQYNLYQHNTRKFLYYTKTY